MNLPILDTFRGASFNLFDGLVLVWLIVGLFRGRKHGMSEELLLVFQWLLIVVVCGYTYRPIGDLIHQAAPAISQLWAYLFTYLFLAFFIRAAIVRLKVAAGEKLVGSDLFGKGEYYLGMMAGVVRFGCMAIMFLALMNAHVVSKAERDATEKIQKKSFGDGINFPTYGSIQQTVLFQSFTGNMARKHLDTLLIASVSAPPPAKPRETIARKEQRSLDEITGSGKK